MTISVIIPVYNAAPFLAKAVQSALCQSAVEEVLLIEDGSSDNSYELCLGLAQKYNQVRLLSHPGHKNRGASASRNLGLKQAKCDLIAFLDADDYYLSDRFDQALSILQTEANVDGVFEAIGIHFYDDSKRPLFVKELTTMQGLNLSKYSLFEYLAMGNNGYFSLDGLVIRKETLDKVGVFDESLKVTEDTDFIWRLALHANLQPGSLEEAVVMRGVHENNGIFNRPFVNHYARQLYHKWFLKMLKADWSARVNWAFTVKKLEGEARHYTRSEQRGLLRVAKLLILPFLFLRYPILIRKLVGR